MKHTLNQLMVVGLVPALFVSCSTGKHAYEGDKRDVSELATIEVVATENSKALLGNHKETPNVTHVDDYEVGSYIGGFPK